jgi:hypothetical protein
MVNKILQNVALLGEVLSSIKENVIHVHIISWKVDKNEGDDEDKKK